MKPIGTELRNRGPDQNELNRSPSQLLSIAEGGCSFPSPDPLVEFNDIHGRRRKGIFLVRTHHGNITNLNDDKLTE